MPHSATICRFDSPALAVLRPAIDALAAAHHNRDPETHAHERRTAELAVAIGALVGLPPPRLELLRLAAIVHDIGKLGVPSVLLEKQTALSADETLIVRSHCAIGRDILTHLNSQLPLAEIVFQHHERLDGSGYPQRLRGAAILHEARILAVADVCDALCSHRPYHPPLERELAIETLAALGGRALDADAVSACTLHLLAQTGHHAARIPSSA